MRPSTRALLLFLASGLVPGLAAGFVGVGSAVAAESCDQGLCIVSGDEGARWEPGATSTPKNRKRRSTKDGATLDFEVASGRASLFVNGRFRGTAPLEDLDVPSGKNDIQVRDGDTVLAAGLLTVPRGGSVSIRVEHP